METQVINFVHPPVLDYSLQLSPVDVYEDYLREWNEIKRDFVCLTRNGQLISNCLYRIGGMGCDINDNYFMLLKYVESVYNYDFIKKCYPQKKKQELELLRKHLEGRWCIFDKNGVEKKEFKSFDNPYLVKDSCLYSIDSNYYNIETGEFYCHSPSCLKSSEYIFLENNYDKDLTKRGIMQINKKDGTWSVLK